MGSLAKCITNLTKLEESAGLYPISESHLQKQISFFVNKEDIYIYLDRFEKS